MYLAAFIAWENAVSWKTFTVHFFFFLSNGYSNHNDFLIFQIDAISSYLNLSFECWSVYAI